MKLVVGLGNPGDKYIGSRHNLGFDVADLLVKQLEASFAEEKSLQAWLAKITSQDLVVIKPTTFYNLSGEAVQRTMQYYKIRAEDVLVVRDDIDLEVGKIRIKAESGSGGNNGIKNIIERVGDKFTQLKIGTGRPQNQTEIEHYVLKGPTKEEQALLGQAAKEALVAIKTWLEAA